MHILQEHAEWLVVEKPAGLLIHPTRPDGTRTLWHELIEAFPDEKLSLVNRLDRETSGLVVVARGGQAASTLGKMIQARMMEKEYLALVVGKATSEGVIDAPLDRLGKYQPSEIYLKRWVCLGGYPCVTHFRRLGMRRRETGEFISLLRVRTETGRLHQIRVHLAFVGLSVLGDKIYGADEQCYLEFIRTGWTSELEKKIWFSRHALHACSVSFDWEGAPVKVESPLPEDMEIFWNHLLPVE